MTMGSAVTPASAIVVARRRDGTVVGAGGTGYEVPFDVAAAVWWKYAMSRPHGVKPVIAQSSKRTRDTTCICCCNAVINLFVIGEVPFFVALTRERPAVAVRISVWKFASSDSACFAYNGRGFPFF